MANTVEGYCGDVPAESPPDAVLDLIRRTAVSVLQNLPEEIGDLDAATLSAYGMAPVAADPELSAATVRVNHSNVTFWLHANIARPGEPVPANTGREVLDYFRNAVRRGLDSTGLDAFRTGQNAAWLRWMPAVFALTDDLDDARIALQITAESSADFVDRTIRAVSEAIRSEREELLRSSQAEKREIVELIVAGQAISPERATRVLGYHLHASHTAFVVWTPDADPDSGLLADTARDIAAAWGATRTLTVVPSAGSLWVWVDAAPSGFAASRIPDRLQVAIGSHGHGLEGFRSSHLEAVTVQQMLARLDSPRRIATIDDIALVNLATKDPIAADDFMRRTLGELTAADAGIREVLRVHLHEGSSVSRTAAALHMHRNTVVRHVAKAVQLLPRPLDDPIAVAVALDIAHWRGAGDPVRRPAAAS